jgi:predicted nucleotide-binding protein
LSTHNQKEELQVTRFKGKLGELKAAVTACKLTGDWCENDKNAFHSFRADTGEILNWWPRTGTVQFQGKHQEEFKGLLSTSVGTRSTAVPTKVAAAGAEIFIVRGHDRQVRDQVEEVLRPLGLGSLIYGSADGNSASMIEGLERHASGKPAFVIILVTPKDDGCKGDVGA